MYEYANLDKLDEGENIRSLFFKYENEIIKSKKPTIIFDKFLYELSPLIKTEPELTENDDDQDHFGSILY